MKIYIAYALLTFGAPIVIGGWIGLLFAWFPDKVNEIINGIIYTILSFLMFYFLSIKATIIVPLILAVIASLWLSLRKEYKEILWQLIGISITAIGYFLIFDNFLI
jgi:hypothetical protein